MSDSPIMQNVVWEVCDPPKETKNGIPYVTHEGVLEMMGKRMRCFRLSNGEAVFEAEDFKEFVRDVLGIDIDALPPQPQGAPEP